jgi:hypothetical protein
MTTSFVKGLTHTCSDHDRSIVKPLEITVSIEHPGDIQETTILKIYPRDMWVSEVAMTFKHQSPFKEGEVTEILQRLRDSQMRLHSEAVSSRDALRDQFGSDWFAGVTVTETAAEETDDAFSGLNSLLTQRDGDKAAVSLYAKDNGGVGESIASKYGLFADEPSYPSSNPEPRPECEEGLPSHSLCPQPEISGQADHAIYGVNAKKRHSKQKSKPLSTPGRAGLVANFHLSHEAHLVAIGNLHTDLDRDQLQALLKTDAFIQKLMKSYQGTGELPGWAKFVSSEMKQYFRLHLLCTKPDAKTITIRLDRDSAEAALAAPRGPANHLAEIIKRTLAKLGIETGLAFNLEFNHTGSTENHPLHIHGALCIPEDKVEEVSEALRKALAMDYRQRYKNLAVHIEKPRNSHWWAAYCIKEYDITACRLETERGRKSRPDYATQKLTREAKAFYEKISVWLNT